MKQEKQRVTKYIETIIYGMTGMVFAAAFFFGILYPDMGISGSVCYEQGSTLGCEQEDCAYCHAEGGSNRVPENSALQISDLEGPFSRPARWGKNQKPGKEDVIYASYFYECLMQKEP